MKTNGLLKTLQDNVDENSEEIDKLSHFFTKLEDRIFDLEDQMNSVIASGFQEICLITLAEHVEELQEKILGEEPRFPLKKKKNKKAVKKKAVKKKREKPNIFPVDVIIDKRWECKCYSQDELKETILDALENGYPLYFISLYNAQKEKLDWAFEPQIEFLSY